MSDLVIGVDGGGTKTVAWLAPLAAGRDESILGRGWAGPGNPRSAGFEVAQENIDAAIDAAFADARLPRAEVAAARFGLAGAGREPEQSRIAAWARGRRIASVVQICADSELVLAAASPENWGIALLCGTGSLAWGRNRSGQVARCGGWGYLLGDEGSAYAIARAGLNAAVRAADGRGEQTLLLDGFLRSMGAASASELVDRIYAPETTPAHLAGAARIVFEAAETDSTARKIIGAAAAELAEMIVTLFRNLAFTSGQYPLALAGGVVLSQQTLRDQIQQCLQRCSAEPGTIYPVAEPVLGAVRLARSVAARI